MTDLNFYNIKESIIIADDNIIKVIKDDDKYYYGYNILTEEFKKVFKNHSVKINKTLIRLLGDESIRVKLALSLTNNNAKAAKMLNLSGRTLFRIKKDYFDVEE